MSFSTKTTFPRYIKPIIPTVLVLFGLLVFCGLFILIDQTYYNFVRMHFPNIGTSTFLATLFGIVSRMHVLIPCILLAIWRPRFFGFQFGKIVQYWRMLLIMLVINCGVIAAYLWLTGGGTPYSGNQWLVTEAIIVPVIEETFWRGIVLMLMLLLIKRFQSEYSSNHLAVWSTGIAFGLLHLANAFAGVPIQFVLLQCLNAVVWGVVYSYARMKTESVYPSMVMHAAMNLVVVFF
jgi:membrane protease YdiL (CAAX protease family)